MVVLENKIEIGCEGLFVEGHPDRCTRFAFLIEDPIVRLDISKDEHDNIFIIKAKSEYKYEQTIAYIIEYKYDEETNQRISDHWLQVKLENGKLHEIKYNRHIGFGEVFIRDQRIIHNGTFYRLTELNKYL